MDIVDHWLAACGCSPKEIEAARGDALTWTIERGSRSGRVAWQFARDYAGKLGKTAVSGVKTAKVARPAAAAKAPVKKAPARKAAAKKSRK